MINFIEKFESIVSEYGDKTALDDGNERITYAELDRRSAMIYAYLKKKGLSKEDFIIIFLPRRVDMIAAMLGILKAGAAFVPLEDSYPEERVAFITEDVGAKLVLDTKLLDDIYTSVNPLPGHERTDLHDAAYVIYTSGSTGNPKGILHEYGNLDQCMMTAHKASNMIIGLMAPFYFVACTMAIVAYLSNGDTIYIIAHDMVRDFKRLTKFIYDNRIERIYLPPSYIRIYTNPSPFLKVIVTGSEPANGLYYPEGRPKIINSYSMSEAGFTVLAGVLDKKYDVAPVGKPVLDIPYFLIDEENNVVEGAGQGELCFKNEYVRGYINLPEKTAAAFVDGIYHTGDIARRDEQGRYYIAGRIDDMIKINGNRIEPAEIEAKIQDITGLKKVIAKGFVQENRSFICLYYIRYEAEELGIYNDGELNIDKERLAGLLPEYMLPAYYVPLEAFPLNPNGKIAKKLLQCPDISDYHSDYEPPANEKEKFFCELFEKVLGLKKAGRRDDFFLMGGDSLRAIQFIAECSKYEITSKELYEYKTPEKLALICREKDNEQAQRFDERMREGYTEENISGLPFVNALKAGVTSNTCIYLKHNVNVHLLEMAWKAVLKCYPFYSQYLEIKEGRLFYVRAAVDTGIKSAKEKIEFENYPRVCADGNRILVKIPHAYTDGFGMKFFLQALIKEYCLQIKGSSSVTDAPAYIEGQYYDMLFEDYSLYEKDTPRVYKELSDVYHLPQNADGVKGLFRYDIEIDKEEFRLLEQNLISDELKTVAEKCTEIGGAASAIIANIIAGAIRRIHPDNELPIACRCPVNLRSILGYEESLKNTSLCQVVFSMDNTDMLTGISNALNTIQDALNADVLKWQLSKIKAILTGADVAEDDRKIIDRLFNPTFLLSNVMNNSAQDYPEEIESIEPENTTNIPLFIILGNLNDKIQVSFIQQFENDIYSRIFKAQYDELLNNIKR